jgi:tetratricopeptide (TPR) repeat protein
MNSYTFLASGDEQHYSKKSVAKSTSTFNAQYQDAIGSESCAAEDSYLRSCALKFAKQGDYIDAIALFNHLIHRQPENAVNYNNRGLVYFQYGEREKALRDYNVALGLNPKLASAYNNRANYYAACGKLEEAVYDYDEALDLNPTYTRAWINRGITLRDLGQYEEAIDNFEIALLFEQYEGHIIGERGRTHHIAGDWNCAVADYRRALALLPISPNSKDSAGLRLRSQVENWLGELLCP